jgi:hypothetical protein
MFYLHLLLNPLPSSFQTKKSIGIYLFMRAGCLNQQSLLHCLALSGRYTLPNKQTLWSESASELYRPRDSRLSAKLVPTFADRGCHVVSVTGPYGGILGFLDRHIAKTFIKYSYRVINLHTLSYVPRISGLLSVGLYPTSDILKETFRKLSLVQSSGEGMKGTNSEGSVQNSYH